MKILSLFAHPDDETMLSGGTLAYLAKAGHEVVYVCATRGEGGERGEPPFCEPEQLGEFRANELTCAIAALGGGKLIYLDYIDPFIGPEDTLFAYSDDEEEVIQKILLILSEEKPDVVITHGSSGEYGHPAHLLTHRAALAAYAAYADPDLQIYTVFAAFDGHPKPRNVNVNDAADIILDLEKDPAVLQAKIDGALCHQTQNALFIRRPTIEFGRKMEVAEVVLRVESLHRVFPRIANQNTDAFVQIFQQSGMIRSFISPEKEENHD